MANYANLEAAIVAAVYENANNEITGAALQSVLLQMVSSMGKSGMLCNGVADGSTTPPVNPDSNIFYIAPTGTYPNFGGLVVADGEWAIFIYNGSWQKQSVPVVTADAVPTTGSTNPVQSGGVADALEQKADIDGYYSTLTAGAAENLVGRGSVLAEYTRRTSGGSASIGSGAATIEKIHGNTIAWNQLINAASVSYTNLGLTITAVNGHYTISGTASGNGGFALLPRINTVAGHKYFVHLVGTHNFLSANWRGVDMSTLHSIVFTETVNTSNVNLQINVTSGQSYSADYWYYVCDLTLMFGAGNEPSTAAEFEALFPLNYYAYDTGSLVSLTGTGIETNGFNQVNLADLPTQTGMGSIDSSGAWYVPTPVTNKTIWKNDFGYTGRMYIKFDVKYSGTSAGLRFVWRYTDGTYVIIYPTISTSYVSVSSLSASGKVVSELFTDYGSTAIQTWIQNLVVNFSWSGYRNGEYEAYWDSILALPITTVTSGGTAIFPNGMRSAGVIYDELTATKAIKRCDKRAYTAGDESDSTVITDGTNTIYALTTPVEYTLDSELNLNYRVDDFGTETLLPQNNATPTTAPIVYDVRYAMNAVDTLRNLPTNYISKDSLKNLLDALVSAGVISAYTMTYNAGTEQYTFTITA